MRSSKPTDRWSTPSASVAAGDRGRGEAVAHGVDDGEAGVVGVVGDVPADRLVEHPRPERAPDHRHDEAVGGQARALARAASRPAARSTARIDAAHRRAGDLGTRQRRAVVGHRDRRRRTGRQRRSPGPGGGRTRPRRPGCASAPGGQHAGQAGVAADRDHHPRPQPARAAHRLPRSPSASLGAKPRLRVGRRTPLHPDDVEERVRVRRRRQQLGLDAALGADVVERRPAWPAPRAPRRWPAPAARARPCRPR